MSGVTVAVEGADLVVRLGGRDRLFALRKEVRVPLRSVSGVEVASPAPRPRGLRAPGTAWPFRPGRRIAGTWRSRAGKEFQAVRRGERALVVDVTVGFPWRRIVVELDDPEGTAATIRAALAV